MKIVLSLLLILGVNLPAFAQTDIYLSPSTPIVNGAAVSTANPMPVTNAGGGGGTVNQGTAGSSAWLFTPLDNTQYTVTATGTSVPLIGAGTDQTTGAISSSGFQSVSVQVSAGNAGMQRSEDNVTWFSVGQCTASASTGAAGMSGNAAAGSSVTCPASGRYFRVISNSGTTTATVTMRFAAYTPGAVFVNLATGNSQANPLFASESAASIASGQFTVTTTSQQICAARTGRRAVTIQNLGTTQVFIGPTGVTTTSGTLVPGVAGSSVTIPTSAAIFGVVATGSQAIACLETF